MRKRSDRRNDILVTYADTEGKSGQFYAVKYAEANRVSSKNIASSLAFSNATRRLPAPPSMIVFVDDLISTGRSFASNFRNFVAYNSSILKQLGAPVTIMALSVTSEGEQFIRRMLEEFDWLNIDLVYADLVSSFDRAFSVRRLFLDN